MGRGGFLRGHPRPFHKGVGPSPTQFGGSILFMHTHRLSLNYRIRRDNTYGKGLFLWDQPLPLKGMGSRRSPILGFLCCCLHPLTQNDQIRHGNTYGEGCVLIGQPCHCICTNASRGLSAIAEFLV